MTYVSKFNQKALVGPTLLCQELKEANFKTLKLADMTKKLCPFLEDDAPTTLSEGEYVRAKDLPKPNRVLFANSIMTMDYRTDRLNVHVDDNMKVKGVSFG
ncbi:hypothetical protein CU097_014854 [Rhizopus azygosporus]|uniref:Uncharacterized protein n=1 Tax=Rhizopus azygosporus TaxID=86630 RepID=A0A367KG89_RHIAZ|nr:hypothetical protein CU097_014854 [Rhizopus azygosporus]